MGLEPPVLPPLQLCPPPPKKSVNVDCANKRGCDHGNHQQSIKGQTSLWMFQETRLRGVFALHVPCACLACYFY